MCPIDRASIVESVEGISFNEWCDLPLVLLPCETELVSMVDDCVAILECPSGLDFDIEVDWSIQVWSVLKDESVSPVVLFLVEGSILDAMLDSEVIVCEQFMGEFDTVLSGYPEVCVSIHDLDGTNLASYLCVP